jgi:hypothetical protein
MGVVVVVVVIEQCAQREREKAGREKRVMQYWWKMRGERVRCGLEEVVRCVYE